MSSGHRSWAILARGISWFDNIILKGGLYQGSRVLTVIAGINIMALMVIVVVDVISRHSPINPPWGSGGFEISEMLMVLVSTMAVAWCWYAGGHIRIELVLERVSSRRRVILNILASFCSIIWLVAVTWSVMQITTNNIKFGLTTDLLKIDVWPFQLIFVVVMSHFGLVMLRSLVEYIRMAFGRKMKPWAIIEGSV